MIRVYLVLVLSLRILVRDVVICVGDPTHSHGEAVEVEQSGEDVRTALDWMVGAPGEDGAHGVGEDIQASAGRIGLGPL